MKKTKTRPPCAACGKPGRVLIAENGESVWLCNDCADAPAPAAHTRTFSTARECAEFLLTTGDENPFFLRTFQLAMANYGFTDRHEAGLEFRRLLDAGRIVRAGEWGLAYTYKVQNAQ